MSDIITAMGSALFSTLAAGTALTTALGGTAIYLALAPQGTSPPYVIFNYSAGGDDNSSPRRARTQTWTVKAVSTTGMKNAAEIDNAVDALLHEQQLTVTGWDNYWMARTSDIAYAEQAGGALYWHVGGQYRIRLAES